MQAVMKVLRCVRSQTNPLLASRPAATRRMFNPRKLETLRESPAESVKAKAGAEILGSVAGWWMFRLGSGGQLCSLAFYRKHLVYFYRFSLCWCFSGWTYHHEDSWTRSSVIRALLFAYVCARSIPADRTGPGGLAGGFPCRNLFTNDVLFTQLLQCHNMWARLKRLYASGKNEDVEKSHVSILLKRLYVFVSAWERMVWLCASASHYTTPRSWPVSQSRDVTLTRCWPGSFFCLVPSSFLRRLWTESQLVCPRVRRNLRFHGLVCPPCGKLLLGLFACGCLWTTCLPSCSCELWE